MYINAGSMLTQNLLLSAKVGGGLSPFSGDNSRGPTAWGRGIGDQILNVIDPFGIFKKTKKTIEHAVDTADHIVNRGIDTGKDVADLGADLVHKGGEVAKDGLEGLERLVQLMTKILPVILIGSVVLMVLK